MAKQINPRQLAHIFCRALLSPSTFDTKRAFEKFVTDAGDLLTDHFGSELANPASTLADVTYIGVIANLNSPADGGIFKDYDVEGQLFDDNDKNEPADPASTEMETEANVAFVVTGADSDIDSKSLDTLLQVDFPALIEQEFDDYQDCPEWRYIQKEASFNHSEVSEYLVHTACLQESSIPQALLPTVQLAREHGIVWILFHLG